MCSRLGWNRELFTTLMSIFADKLVYVEAQSKFEASLKHLLVQNIHMGEVLIFNKYIGGNGYLSQNGLSTIIMAEVINQSEIKK